MATKARTARLTRSDAIAEALGSLGCPGFFQLSLDFGLDDPPPPPDPSVVLVAAVACDNLKPHVRAALPWLVLHFPDIDWKWAVAEARRRGVQNRLGFIVTLAEHRAAHDGGYEDLLARLIEIEETLFEIRQDREDTFCEDGLPERERRWLRDNRPREAAAWNLLTDVDPQRGT